MIIRNIFYQKIVVAIILACITIAAYSKEKPRVILIHTPVSSAVETLYSQIAEGIEREGNYRVITENIKTGLDDIEIRKSSGLIALDSKALHYAKTLKTNVPIFNGASITYSGIPGVSVYVEPEQYFQKLLQIRSNITKVIYFYSDNHNHDILNSVKKSSEKFKLSLEMIQIDDLKSAVRKISNKLTTLKPNSEAIWFSWGVINLNENILLPLIIEESWEKNIIVFSNNPKYVSYGFLFSLFPDFKAIGRKLSKLITEEKTKHAFASLNITSLPIIEVPFQTVEENLFILNQRSMSHLGLKITNELEKDVDVLVPNR